jgi:hypothetical protein
MKCDICGLAWDSVRVLYHNGTPVIHACTNCIADDEPDNGYVIRHHEDAALGEWWSVETKHTQSTAYIADSEADAQAALAEIMQEAADE